MVIYVAIVDEILQMEFTPESVQAKFSGEDTAQKHNNDVKTTK